MVCNCNINVIDDYFWLYENNNKKFYSHYSFSMPWVLEEITADHYLTHYKPVDPEIESKLKRISNEIDSHQYHRWVWGRSYWGDKYDKENYFSIKYSEDRIYHSEDEQFIDS
jgi:hypothetical protein